MASKAGNTKTNETKQKPWRLTKWHADHLRWATPIFMSSLGYLYPNPKLWFETLGLFFAFLAVVLIIVSTFWEFVSYYMATPPGQRIQAHKKLSTILYTEETLDALQCMYIVACLSAWPMTMHRDGRVTAFKPTIEECAFFGSYAYYGVKVLMSALVSDAWTFWKHYLFHKPMVYAIHKDHHVYHNPSTFAGFAIHPVEAFWTFCPILAMCIPQINLWAPMHLPFIAAFYSLNLYLHCGYSIPLLEKVLSACYINTSEWHNKHHEYRMTHFGEMTIMWDLYMGTHTGDWDEKKHKDTSAMIHLESDTIRGVATEKGPEPKKDL